MARWKRAPADRGWLVVSRTRTIVMCCLASVITYIYTAILHTYADNLASGAAVLPLRRAHNATQSSTKSPTKSSPTLQEDAMSKRRQQAEAHARAAGAQKDGSLGVRSDGRMNVLFVVADDYRPQASIFGKPAITPNLDRIAARGVVFDRAYAQITVCNPSRNSFLTGRVPDITQVWNFERTVNDDMVDLPSYFAGQGYLTAGTGKIWHWGPGPGLGQSWQNDLGENGEKFEFWPNNIRFQELISVERALLNESTVRPIDEPAEFFIDGKFSLRACDLIENITAAVARSAGSVDNSSVGKSTNPLDSRPPFFLAVGFHMPHEPLLVPFTTWELYDDESAAGPLLRGDIAKSPQGMPAYARGDILPEYYYYDLEKSGGKSGEKVMRNFGPSRKRQQPIAIKPPQQRELPVPDAMRSELLRGYAAGASFLDQEFGKVVDTVEWCGLKDSTIVVFFSDHGYALGERGQWGKRSLFESDARVPLVIADPRYPSMHGSRTASFLELIDIFPTLVDLAGIPPADSLVPPLSGVSRSTLVQNQRKPHSLPEFAVTQFSRCPVTASEYLLDITGKGPMLKREFGVKDFRALWHDAGVSGWECTWKGWQWDEHHDLALMGYSIRVSKWRYTAWIPWNAKNTSGVWTYPPLGEELYAHEQGNEEPPGLFDELESRNLLASLASRQSNRRLIRGLFERLRTAVLRRRGIVTDNYLLCDQIEQRVKRENCKTQLGNQMGFQWKRKLQISPQNDSSTSLNARDVQKSPSVESTVGSATPALPFREEEIPSAVWLKLELLQMLPNTNATRLNAAIARYESVAKIGDFVVVADPANLLAWLESDDHHQTKCQWGFRYRIVEVLKPDESWPPNNEHAVDLQLKYKPDVTKSAALFTAELSQAMGLGYLPRDRAKHIIEKERKLMPRFSTYDETVFDNGSGPALTSELPSALIPPSLFVQTRTVACAEGASWADQTFNNIQWLPIDLAEFNSRLEKQGR